MAGQKRLNGRQEKTQKQARKDSKTDKKRLKDRHDKPDRHAWNERLKGRQKMYKRQARKGSLKSNSQRCGAVTLHLFVI